MCDLLLEATTLVRSWTNELDAPTKELRMIEKLIIQLKQSQFDLEQANKELISHKEAQFNQTKKINKLEQGLFDKNCELEQANKDIQVLAEALRECASKMIGGYKSGVAIVNGQEKYENLANKYLTNHIRISKDE